MELEIEGIKNRMHQGVIIKKVKLEPQLQFLIRRGP